MTIKESFGDRLLKAIMYTLLSLFSIYCIVPFIAVISSSFSSEISIIKHGYSIVPKDFTLDNYKLIFKMRLFTALSL